MIRLDQFSVVYEPPMWRLLVRVGDARLLLKSSRLERDVKTAMRRLEMAATANEGKS